MSNYRIPPGWTNQQFIEALLANDINSRKIAAEVKSNYLETGLDQEKFELKNKSIIDKLSTISDVNAPVNREQRERDAKLITTLNVIKSRTPAIAPNTAADQQAIMTLALQEAVRVGQQQAIDEIQRTGARLPPPIPPPLPPTATPIVPPVDIPVESGIPPAEAAPSFGAADKEFRDAKREFYVAYRKELDPSSNIKNLTESSSHYKAGLAKYGLTPDSSLAQFENATRHINNNIALARPSTIPPAKSPSKIPVAGSPSKIPPAGTKIPVTSRTSDPAPPPHIGVGFMELSPNQTRLKLLTGSITAGNKSRAMRVELMKLIDRMLVKKELTKLQHKKIYKMYLN